MAKKERTISPLAQLLAQLQGQMGSVSNFDPLYAAAIKRALLSKSDLDRGYSTAAEEAKIGFDEARQMLQQQKVLGYENNEGNFSGNGLLRSGIFASEQGKVGENFQKGLTSAAQRRTSTINSAADARLSGYNQIQAGLEDAQAGSAVRASEAARQAELQKIATDQQNALLNIQRQGISQQQATAQQQLDLYRRQMQSTGTGSTVATWPNQPSRKPPPGVNNRFQGPGAAAIIRRLG